MAPTVRKLSEWQDAKGRVALSSPTMLEAAQAIENGRLGAKLPPSFVQRLAVAFASAEHHVRALLATETARANDERARAEALVELHQRSTADMGRTMRERDEAVARERAARYQLLWCPECGERHVDVGEFATKEHHTHACQECGHIWRPALGPTFGVRFLPGFKNDESAPSKVGEWSRAQYGASADPGVSHAAPISPSDFPPMIYGRRRISEISDPYVLEHIRASPHLFGPLREPQAKPGEVRRGIEAAIPKAQEIREKLDRSQNVFTARAFGFDRVSEMDRARETEWWKKIAEHFGCGYSDAENIAQQASAAGMIIEFKRDDAKPTGSMCGGPTMTLRFETFLISDPPVYFGPFSHCLIFLAGWLAAKNGGAR